MTLESIFQYKKYINVRLITAIKNQSNPPRTKGFTPTILIVERDNPAPIKKSVIVRLCLETDTISWVIDVGIVRYVFITIARIKKNINQGMTTLSPFDLK